MRIVTAARRYPMSMARFFDAAMRRLGHDVVTVGPYSGDGGAIPWPGAPTFPQYVDRPDIILPEHLGSYPITAIKSKLDNPDLIVSFDAGFRLLGEHSNCKSILYGTDPHAINYQPYYQDYAHFFSAQRQSVDTCPGAIWIPLAYDPTVHVANVPIAEESRPLNICFVGVMGTSPGPENAYYQRYQAVRALLAKFGGFAKQGLIFDECTEVYNQAKIAFNWSSSWDLPMRLWEGAAYGCCVVTNRLPYLEDVGFFDGETCIAFDSHEEMMSKVTEAIDTGSWVSIAKAGHDMVQSQTYDARVEQILEYVF